MLGLLIISDNHLVNFDFAGWLRAYADLKFRDISVLESVGGEKGVLRTGPGKRGAGREKFNLRCSDSLTMIRCWWRWAAMESKS